MMTVRVTKHVGDGGAKYFEIDEEDRAAAEAEYRQYQAAPSRASGRKSTAPAAGAGSGGTAGAGLGGPERVAVVRGGDKRPTTTYLRSGPKARS